ncbi:MAG: lipopolysaccharide biosynthesis protein [Bacteroidales bacterium]|nr:lipopolysaccharide biosynthesis protein [Bacteroidales bacterium]
MDNLKKQTVTSVVWSAIDRFASQGIQFVMSIIIARLLLPSDYGLIAMLSIFLAVAQTFVDSGFGTALIQKKDRTEADYSTAFYFNFGVAVLAYLLLFWAAPYIADFYHQDKLTSVTRVVGLTLIINSLGLVQWAKLSITLDFKKLAVASVIAVTISGLCGVWMAYHGYGVWSLVAQTLLNNLTNMLIMWVLSKWHPVLVFSKDSFYKLFSFGSKLLLSSLLHTVYTNLYTLVIGKRFSSSELGFYNRSSTIAQFSSSNLATVIVRAIYPIQCRMQDDDERLKYFFMKYLRLSCYIIFPITIGICSLAEPLVLLVLKDKWLPAVPLLQILSIAYMWDPIMKMNCSILNVKGRSDYFLKAEIIKKVTGILILIATIPFGVKVMCLGLILYAFADMRIITIYTKKMMGLRLSTQIKELYPILLLSVSMGMIVYGTSLLFGSPALKLIFGTVAGLVYYVLVSWLARFEEFEFLLSLIEKKKKLSDI